MDYNFETFGMEQIENIVSLLNQCTDSYIFIFDLDNDIFSISSRAKDDFDFSYDKFSGAAEKLLSITYPEDVSLFRMNLDALKGGQRSEMNLECRWKSRSGNPVWVRFRGRAIPSADNRRVLLGNVEILHETDNADAATGLFSETQLKSDFSFVRERKGQVSGFILKIDIDNISIINEQYGVSTGDSVVKKVAACCRKVCSGTARAYKIEGDKFICMNLSGKAAPMAQKLYRALKREIAEAEKGIAYDVVFTVSGGAVAFLNETAPLEDILKKLNYSLSMAKLQGRNTLVMFNAVDYSKHLREIDLQECLRISLKNDFEGFELYYQPFIDAKKIYLDSDRTVTNVVGCEALLRFSCEKYGMLSPDEFIPILERTGMIVPVGRWILKTAFNQCREWNRVQKEFKMSVNLSYIQVRKSEIVEDVETALVASGVNPANVTLELTESGYIDNALGLQRLTENFAKLGVNVDIDDFGTGYSNLRYLQYLHATTLKLDYTFVHRATNGNEGDKNVIKHIAEMAHELKMKVCMEGVETAEDVEKLLVYSPDKFQGFYFGRPCSAVNFRELHVRPNAKLETYK
ncbi:MAG: EAL domain-containing protein [Treponema sp.]|nr:EAL domain-containing protein [Treponema sp.]